MMALLTAPLTERARDYTLWGCEGKSGIGRSGRGSSPIGAADVEVATFHRYDYTKRPELYRLAEEAQINVSNLTVRLQRLGIIYLRDGDKTIYRNEDERSGQRSLF